MNQETQDQQAERDREESPRPAWFATFSFLDISGAITSSESQRLLAPIRKLWQRVFGKVT